MAPAPKAQAQEALDVNCFKDKVEELITFYIKQGQKHPANLLRAQKAQIAGA